MSSSAAESFYEDSKMSYARDNLPYASNLKNNTTNRVEYGYTDNITPNTLREFLKPIEQVPIHN